MIKSKENLMRLNMKKIWTKMNCQSQLLKLFNMFQTHLRLI